MAQTSWTQFAVNFFSSGAARSPESYLEFSRQCLEEVRTMTLPRESKSSEVINYEQCVHLAERLDKAVDKASLFLSLNRQNGGIESALEHLEASSFISLNRQNGGIESSVEHLKVLCMLAKKVKCFIQGCCDGHWLQAAVMSTNLSDCTVSLGFEMRLFEILLPPWTSASTLSLSEVSALRHSEGELAKTMAFKDENRLVTQLRAFIQYGHASNYDVELAMFLLERLTRFNRRLHSISPGSLQPTLHERDLTNVKDMVQIARGGYGTVHKASWFGIDVAVKTFFGTDNPDFNKEVTILAGLSHPNIVSFLCHGKDVGECCIVMELMDRDLFSLLKERLRNNRTRSSPFSVFEEVDVMLQIAEAMDYLHEMRVLHRDLKSANILVRCMKSPNVEGHEYVQVKVSDFGLSRTKEFSMTQSHLTPNTGTNRWIAPELIKFLNTNGDLLKTREDEELVSKNYPFKCDVYSFGMVCLEILTGDVPFPNMTPNDVKRAVCAGERPQIPDRCHEKLKALIEKCWNREASSRPCFGDICAELRYLKSIHMTLSPFLRFQLIRSSMAFTNADLRSVTFTIADLRSVTGNFAESNLLSRNAISVVHKGILPDGTKVAVKRFVGAVTRLGLEFIELQVRGWISARHWHLVETFGYCFDDYDFLLVKKYISGGTLAELLSKYDGVKPPHPFTWKLRWKIAKGIAQALIFICGIESISKHFLLKSTNVFLDDDFNAKVSGSGQTRGGAVSWLPQGATPSGGMTPNYTWAGMRTKEDHVYSFGVVLMELLTGRPSENKERDLVTWFRKLVLTQLRPEVPRASIDLRLALGLNFYLDEYPATETMLKFVMLAMECTATDPDLRPGIGQVLRVLESDNNPIWKYQSGRMICFSHLSTSDWFVQAMEFHLGLNVSTLGNCFHMYGGGGHEALHVVPSEGLSRRGPRGALSVLPTPGGGLETHLKRWASN